MADDKTVRMVTNLDRKSCERLTEGVGVLQLTAGGQAISRIVSTYTEIGPGEIAALFGGTDHLEFAMRTASAAERLAVKTGDPVELRRV